MGCIDLETDVSLIAFLNFVYDRLAITFVMCGLGLVIKESTLSVKQRKLINIPKILLSTLFVTVFMCAINDKMKFSIATYMFLCIISGIWCETLLGFITNGKIVGTLIKLALKSKMSEDKVDEAIEDIVEAIEDQNENDNSEKD